MSETESEAEKAAKYLRNQAAEASDACRRGAVDIPSIAIYEVGAELVRVLGRLTNEVSEVRRLLGIQRFEMPLCAHDFEQLTGVAHCRKCGVCA